MTGVLKLASVPNFRDIAGPAGYVTPQGRLRRGRLFRSNAFVVSPEDLAVLRPLGIADILDLRGQGEIAMHPDSQPPGATWRHTWVPGLGSEAIGALNTEADVRAAMIRHYREFVSVPAKRAGIAAVLVAISDGTGPQVFHYAEGKDRTGWVAMLLHRLAGVADDVLADYLLTNDLVRGQGDTRALARVLLGNRPDDFFAPAMIADAAYLDAGLDQMEADYGDLERYLANGLGLSEAQLERLRDALVDGKSEKGTWT